jgi:hypothetical protein
MYIRRRPLNHSSFLSCFHLLYVRGVVGCIYRVFAVWEAGDGINACCNEDEKSRAPEQSEHPNHEVAGHMLLNG